MHMLTPEDDLAIEWGQRAVAMAERLGAEDVVVHASNNIGSSYAQRGEFEKGISIIEESLQRSLAAGLSIDTCRADINLGIMRQRQCHYSEAWERLRDLHKYASKIYAQNFAVHALTRLIWIDWLTGEWHSALANRALMTDFTNGSYTVQNLTFVWTKRILAMIDLDLGRIGEGHRALEETLASALRANDAQTTVAHLGQLVRAYGASGNEAKVLKTATQILELSSSQDHLSTESIMPLFFACQQLAQMTGLHPLEEMQRCLAELERHARRYQTGEAEAALAESKAILEAEKDPAEAGEHFRQAAAGWESIGRPYDQARVLAAQAQALAAAGDECAARAARNQALQLCDALAAQLDPDSQAAFLASPMVQGLHQTTSEAPPLPARSAGQDVKSLTRRELEVLKLVAEGLTNPQIAERLVVSPLTINAHLRSIFNKLDVTSRTAAARQALELGLV
jgi:DNA-binding CsgD family transcriptional regulator